MAQRVEHPHQGKLYFAISETIPEGIHPLDRAFILKILNERPDLKWTVTQTPEEADWHITIETQFYIDQRVPDESIGESYTYVHQYPFLTRLSFEHWNRRPAPKEAFDDLYAYRRYILIKQLTKLERKPFLVEPNGADVLDVFAGDEQ